MNYKKIRELCELRGISIPELAEQINLTKSGLYLAISKKTLNVEKLESIAQIFNVPIWVFFNLDPEGPLKAKINELEEANKQLQQDFEKAIDINILEDRQRADIRDTANIAKLLLKQWMKAFSILSINQQLSLQYFKIVSKYSDELLTDNPAGEYLYDRLFEELIELASVISVNIDPNKNE